jgi:hypothetical protein
MPRETASTDGGAWRTRATWPLPATIVPEVTSSLRAISRRAADIAAMAWRSITQLAW